MNPYMFGSPYYNMGLPNPMFPQQNPQSTTIQIISAVPFQVVFGAQQFVNPFSQAIRPQCYNFAGAESAFTPFGATSNVSPDQCNGQNAENSANTANASLGPNSNVEPTPVADNSGGDQAVLSGASQPAEAGQDKAVQFPTGGSPNYLPAITAPGHSGTSSSGEGSLAQGSQERDLPSVKKTAPEKESSQQGSSTVKVKIRKLEENSDQNVSGWTPRAKNHRSSLDWSVKPCPLRHKGSNGNAEAQGPSTSRDATIVIQADTLSRAADAMVNNDQANSRTSDRLTEKKARHERAKSQAVDATMKDVLKQHAENEKKGGSKSKKRRH